MQNAEFNATNGVAVTAGFVSDGAHMMVGEPMFLTFVLSNRAEQLFQFSHARNEIFNSGIMTQIATARRRSWRRIGGFWRS
jgi:hypothetical protein